MTDPVINAVLKSYFGTREHLLINMVVQLSKAREDLIERWTKEKMTLVSPIMVIVGKDGAGSPDEKKE